MMSRLFSTRFPWADRINRLNRTTTYTYDAKNRLTNLAAVGGSGANATNLSYAYTLGNAGHRMSVTEASGRKATYGYDNLYRLTNETIAGDANGNSGSIGYSYDAVGNRTQQTSTSPAITSGAFGYDADDRLTGDVYDANGNTISTGGQGITYDFENHILTENGATYAYDGDGNRVRKTVGGITTSYAITSVATSVNFWDARFVSVLGAGACGLIRLSFSPRSRHSRRGLICVNFMTFSAIPYPKSETQAEFESCEIAFRSEP